MNSNVNYWTDKLLSNNIVLLSNIFAVHDLFRRLAEAFTNTHQNKLRLQVKSCNNDTKPIVFHLVHPSSFQLLASASAECGNEFSSLFPHSLVHTNIIITYVTAVG